MEIYRPPVGHSQARNQRLRTGVWTVISSFPRHRLRCPSEPAAHAAVGSTAHRSPPDCTHFVRLSGVIKISPLRGEGEYHHFLKRLLVPQRHDGIKVGGLGSTPSASFWNNGYRPLPRLNHCNDSWNSPGPLLFPNCRALRRHYMCPCIC